MDFFVEHKRQVLLVIGEILLLAGFFFAGAYSHPTKEVHDVHTEYLTKTVMVDHVVYQDKIVEKVITIHDKTVQMHKDKVTTVVVNKDGTKTIVVKEITDANTHVNDKVDVSKTQEITKTEDKKGSSETHTATDTHSLVINDKPSWRGSAGVGVDFTKLSPTSLLVTAPGSYPLVYRLEVDRRLVGTFWLGLSADTNKVVGITAALEF